MVFGGKWDQKEITFINYFKQLNKHQRQLLLKEKCTLKKHALVLEMLTQIPSKTKFVLCKVFLIWEDF